MNAKRCNRAELVRVFAGLLGGFAVLCATGAATAQDAPDLKPVDARVLMLPADRTVAFDGFIVHYRDDASVLDSTSAQALAVKARMAQDLARSTRGGAYSIRIGRRTGTGGHVLTSDRALDAQAANAFMQAMAGNPALESIEPNLRMYAAALPNDPLLSYQWSLWDPVGGINAESAWDAGASGNNIVIAVIDSGRTAHPDLDAKTLPGYDMISDAANARDGNGRDNNPSDQGDWNMAGECGPGAPARSSSWHGTHVAGTAAAITNNGVGVAGVAYGALIQHVRVLGTCGGTLADIADGIVWASGGAVPGVPANPTPARVLNLSLGGISACPATYQNAINGARSRGSVLLVAAGNDSVPASEATPANCAGVVTVAANDPAGMRAPYSNYGLVVDVTAPGGDSSVNPNNGILSTFNAGQTTPGAPSYEMSQGTSMATPHVAGIAALVISRNPSLTPDQVAAILRNTARPFPSYCSGGCGTGIVDAGAAVSAASGAAITVYPLSVLPVGNGAGNITSIPAGINCGTNGVNCSRRFNANASVTLTASPAPGYAFAGWVGACSGSAPTCTVPMNQGRAAYALFDYPLLVMQNGVPITGLASPDGAPRYFQIAIPAGATNLEIRISGGSGDADLHVRRGALPDPQTWDCRPWLYGNNETCSFSNPSAGTWYVMLTGDPDFSGVTLRGSYSLPPANPLGLFCDGMEAAPTVCR